MEKIIFPLFLCNITQAINYWEKKYKSLPHIEIYNRLKFLREKNGTNTLLIL